MIPDEALRRITELRPRRLVIALSGGVDSMALLHAARLAFGAPRLHALHVHHGLHPQADSWEALCRDAATRLSVAFTSRRVTVPRDGNLEAAARAARYEVFETFLEPDDLLLMAHHRGDQAETVLQTLFRGSGHFGVGGMPAERSIGSARLLRPLLTLPRGAIEAWARDQGLDWVNDPSNQDRSMTRNWVRHELMPMIDSRWPGIEQALADAVRRDEGYREVLDFAAALDREQVRAGAGLDVERLEGLPAGRQQNILRHWLDEHGLPQPPMKTLEEGLAMVSGAREDAAPLLAWQGVCLRRFRRVLYLTRELGREAGFASQLPEEGTHRFGDGELLIEIVKGKGLSRRAGFELRPRAPGSEILIRHHRRVARVMQEAGVPPWLRDRLPIVHERQMPVAVPALPDWGVEMQVADGFRAEGSAPGLEIAWRMPGQPYSN